MKFWNTKIAIIKYQIIFFQRSNSTYFSLSAIFELKEKDHGSETLLRTNKIQLRNSNYFLKISVGIPYYDQFELNYSNIIFNLFEVVHLWKKKITELNVSISSTLNVRIFRTNIVLAAFFYVHAQKKSCRNDVCTKYLRV